MPRPPKGGFYFRTLSRRPPTQFLSCRVLVTRAQGARYAGYLVGFKRTERKFCLANTNLVGFRWSQFSVVREPLH